MLLHSKILGKGKPLLILHGFFGMGDNWKTLANKFAEIYEVHLIDQRNHGRSFHTDDFSYELMVEDLENYINHHDLKQVNLLGHSMGGYIGLEYAKKYKEDLTGLVLLNSHALADSEEKKQGRLKQVEILKAGKKELLMKEIIPDMFAENNLNKYKEYIDKFIKIATSTNTQGIIAALLGMRLRENNLDFVHNIAIPLLVLSGNKDKLIPLEITNMHINKNNPNIRIEILENVGHASFIEAPDKTFEIIEKTMLK